MKKAVKAIRQAAGRAPVGWYTGRFGMHTLEAVVKHGGFLYSSDSYSDDLPYWVKVGGAPHLIIPYTLEVNDMKFGVPPGFSSGDGWLQAMKDSFDVLYAEGAQSPKMMSIGLHMRLIGHPARTAGLWRLLDYIGQQKGVWITRRLDIANHWKATHPFPGKGLNE